MVQQKTGVGLFMSVSHVGVHGIVLSIFLHICHFHNKKLGKTKLGNSVWDGGKGWEEKKGNNFI